MLSGDTSCLPRCLPSGERNLTGQRRLDAGHLPVQKRLFLLPIGLASTIGLVMAIILVLSVLQLKLTGFFNELELGV